MMYPDKNVTFCRQEIWIPSMRSRRLEVGAQERTSAREGDTRVSLPLARPFFLGPAMQATGYQIKKQ